MVHIAQVKSIEEMKKDFLNKNEKAKIVRREGNVELGGRGILCGKMN